MGKTILVVDDSSIMRKMIKQTLMGAGHTVVGEAKSGDDAVALYRRLKPELVTMDITMRGMDGIAAAKAILAHDPGARVIILSNLDEDRFSKEAAQIGAKGYINKHKTAEILDLINRL
ncbi:response regulator [Desulfosarcina alkanivorans]|jgi:two-component system chemotaxis response regulator CheY|uniref:Response regulator n=1 Tax=Desulfosarcina alkanivorans TaxID=571177 RepID=A0A5K7YUZ8_9BACT|nr:response regulator [Desulfosarcina alkanivorans]BBO72488.1 response regulator [Desulfosarcina alkanivorans]